MYEKSLQRIDELWELCGPVDCSLTLESLRNDITKFSDKIEPCRNWLINRKKLKNIKKSVDSYTLKHEVESNIDEWVPHSVFVFSALLEGFQLSPSSKRDYVHVVYTNIGATI